MSIQIVNLSSNTTPIVQESKRDEWVNFGVDNNYYNYLYERYLFSPTNNAVINNFAKLIIGDGLTSTEKSEKPNSWAKAVTMMGKEDLFKVGLDLKLYGQATIQVLGGKSLAYLPVQNTRLEKKDNDGNINGVWFSDNWNEIKKYKPTYIPMYGTSKEDIEVIYLQIHTPNQPYYSLPDYVGGLTYCELEEHIADYLLNDVKNGFSGKMMMTFTNGTPSQEIQERIASDIKRKLTGAKGQQLIVNFVDDQAKKTILDTIPLNDAPNHYEYVSNEAQAQILKAHNVTSGLIFGIANSNGFSSNADELKNSWNLYMTSVVSQYQNTIIQALEKFLSNVGNPISLDFKAENPFGTDGKYSQEINQNIKDVILSVNKQEMTYDQARAYLINVLEVDTNEVNKLLPEEVKLSAIDQDTEVFNQLEQFADNDLFDYELMGSMPIYEDDTELNNKLALAYEGETFLKKLLNFASVGTARPNIGSTLDSGDVKVRYRYTGNIKENTRTFCKLMLGANKVYRKEDIIAMGSLPVNAGFGKGGADTYSIWLYKGGARCHHYFTRELYLKKGLNRTSKLDNLISEFEAQRNGAKVPRLGWESTKPNDMPYNGYTAEYYKKHFQK